MCSSVVVGCRHKSWVQFLATAMRERSEDGSVVENGYCFCRKPRECGLLRPCLKMPDKVYTN